jgi:hypothetical protein
VRRLGFTRVHITSLAPRSGTTLLAELMAHGFRFDAHADHELSLFNQPDDARGTVLTKDPVDIVNARPLLRWWPDLWVVCLVRDPRDVVVSRHRGAPETYYVGLNTWNEGYARARRLRGHPRAIELRYEDLAADPDAVQRRIVAWMPQLQVRAPFSTFHEAARPSEGSLRALGSVRPVSASSIGAWRRHKPRLATQLARHGPIDDALVELGYEPDAAWREELAGVEPDGLGSHIPEVRSTGERLARGFWRLRNTVRAGLGLGLRRPVLVPDE